MCKKIEPLPLHQMSITRMEAIVVEDLFAAKYKDIVNAVDGVIEKLADWMET